MEGAWSATILLKILFLFLDMFKNIIKNYEC